LGGVRFSLFPFVFTNGVRGRARARPAHQLQFFSMALRKLPGSLPTFSSHTQEVSSIPVRAAHGVPEKDVAKSEKYSLFNASYGISIIITSHMTAISRDGQI
jgi:hypothetical protein